VRNTITIAIALLGLVASSASAGVPKRVFAEHLGATW
jgi:hypothetical protein